MMLGIPKDRVSYLIRKYKNSFKSEERESIEAPTFNAKPGSKSKVTSDNITKTEFEFITST